VEKEEGEKERIGDGEDERKREGRRSKWAEA